MSKPQIPLVKYSGDTIPDPNYPGVNIPQGKGKGTYEDNGSYDGEWQNGSRHGQGTLYYPDGNKCLEGVWDDDEAIKGILYNPLNGELSYDGEFRDKYKHGNGTFYFPQPDAHNRSKYSGRFESGNIKGVGKYELNDGTTIEGSFIDSNGNGDVRITRKDGSIYTGKIGNFQPNGIGTLTMGNTSYSGSWNKGEKHGLFTKTEKVSRNKEILTRLVYHKSQEIGVCEKSEIENDKAVSTTYHATDPDLEPYYNQSLESIFRQIITISNFSDHSADSVITTAQGFDRIALIASEEKPTKKTDTGSSPKHTSSNTGRKPTQKASQPKAPIASLAQDKEPKLTFEQKKLLQSIASKKQFIDTEPEVRQSLHAKEETDYQQLQKKFEKGLETIQRRNDQSQRKIATLVEVEKEARVKLTSELTTDYAAMVEKIRVAEKQAQESVALFREAKTGADKIASQRDNDLQKIQNYQEAKLTTIQANLALSQAEKELIESGIEVRPKPSPTLTKETSTDLVLTRKDATTNTPESRQHKPYAQPAFQQQFSGNKGRRDGT
jgi:hypothetical protein